MSTFDDILTGINPVFTDLFGKPVVYRPRNGTPRTIRAVVDYQTPDNIVGTQQGRTPVTHVTVENHPTRGFDSSCLDTGGDSIDVAQMEGGTPEPRSIIRVVRQDAGMVTVEVR